MKRIRLLLVLLCLALPVPGAAGAEETSLAAGEKLNQEFIKLFQAGRYQEALPLQERLREIFEKNLGPEHPATLAILNNLAGLYRLTGDYHRALPLLQRVLKAREKTLGPEHPDTAASLNSLAMLYYAMGDYGRALPLYRRALAIREKVRGPDHPEVANSLNNLAALYQATGDYRRALPLYERAVKIREKALGPDDPLTATSLDNLASLHEDLGEYRQALPLYERALKIREKALGPGHPLTANSLNNLASLQATLGAYAQALPFYRRALEIREKTLGPNHPDTAVSLNNLAYLYRVTGDYGQALPLSRRALEIIEKAVGPDHPETATGLNNLALLHRTMGAYNQALPLYQRALQIREKVLGPEHPLTATSLNNLAELYQEMGVLAKALPLFQRSLAIAEKALGPEHPQTATSLNNLAGVYMEMGAADQSLPLYRRALAIDEKTLGSDHPKTALCLNNLAVQYRNLGEYDQALPLYRRALEIREKSLGPDHPDVAESLNNLALLYNAMGAYNLALPMYQRSLKIVEKTLGPGSIYNIALNNLASFYLLRKDYQTAADLFRRGHHLPGLAEVALARGQPGEALRLLEKKRPTWRDLPLKKVQYDTELGAALAGVGRLKDASVALHRAVAGVEDLRRRAPGERAGFFRAGIPGGYVRPYRGLVAVLAEMSLKNEPLPPELQEYGPQARDAAFYFAEGTKARALLETMAQAARQQTRAEIPAELSQREDGLLHRLAALDKQWQQALQGGEEAMQEVQARKAELTGELNALIRELRQQYPAYAALHYPQPLPAAALPLKDHEVLLEYALGENACFVLVVRKGGVRDLVKIPLSRERLEARIRAFMEPLINRRAEIFPLEPAQELYNLLLAGALKDVPETGKVIIVPDGLLGLLPFEALAIKAGTGLKDSVFVGDRFSLSYYQSAAVLALKRTLKEERAGRLLFALGNPVFSPKDPRVCTAPLAGKAQEQAARGGGDAAFKALADQEEWGPVTRSGQARELQYAPLPETEDEVRAIAGLLGVRPAAPDILLNLQANETTFKKSPLADYRYLHFATHADLPGRVQGVKEPFILLGQVGNEGRDNGFLTLHKVLGLHLKAEMIVLSACLTGRGKVMEGEGVVNFSRAFQHAGAQSVVVSLWEVASREAVEYMTLFYRHLLEGKSRAEALNLARRAIKAKYPQPFYWAVFILHGEG